MKNQIKSLPIATEALRASYGNAAILPIEFFKLQAQTLRDLIPGKAARRFLSSGTTQADRSQSFFSAEGLALYREKSVVGFQDILRIFFKEPRAIPGLSLIPSVEEWPDSSLAQMVAWIGEEQTLQYWDGFGAIPEEPVWVFGTAFHFVNLADDGVRVRLPQGSIVIETGGTKGRSRSVTRDELYDLISAHLGVPKNSIVSEYGMCELASQAYDAVEHHEGPEIAPSDRWFRFPGVTPVSVRDRLSRAQPIGEGTLVVHDSLRIDYPWPIRTEDMARVREDGAFQLLGRVPMSPLKGCSMLVEEIGASRSHREIGTEQARSQESVEASAGAKPTHSQESMAASADAIHGKVETETTRLQESVEASAGVKPKHSQESIAVRAAVIHAIARDLLSDADFWRIWDQELEGTRAALWLKEDLAASLPIDANAWIQAAAIARGSAERWLIIPPATHSFAWLYPVLLGAVLGYELHLRAGPADPLVQHMRNRLAPLMDLQIWDSQKRIGTDPLPPVDALMIYGSDETIAAIRKMVPVPVQGFGSSITVSLLQDGESLEPVWKDAFSLLQRGCMSSRVLFVLGHAPVEAGVAPLGPLPLGLELALEHGAFGLRCQGVELPGRPLEGAPLLVLQSFDARQKLADLLVDRALSLAVVTVPKNLWPAFAEWLPAQQNLHKIAVHGNPLALDPERFERVSPGSANAPAWNGLHQKRPLFEYNKQDEKAESKGQEI